MHVHATAEITCMDSGGIKTVPIMDCSMAQILRLRHSKGFRRPFIDNPYLEQITLRQVLSSPLAMSEFLQRCRSLPHCGETTINRLLGVIENLAATQVGEDPRLC